MVNIKKTKVYMRIPLFFLGLLLFMCLEETAHAKNVAFDQGTGKITLLRIRNMILGGDYIGAMRAARDLEKKDTVTAELYLLSGQSHFYLKNYDEALERLERSVKLNPDEHPEKYHYLGRTHQALGKLEEAITNYTKYLASSKTKKELNEDALKFKEQCINSIKMMQNPLDVDIRNVSENINTEYAEYNPSVSADGKIMVFTSRRADGTGNFIDPEDNKFFEDIFISIKDSLTGKWGEASLLPGQVNSEGHEANMCISPDGNQLFIYKNMGMKGSGQIYVSKYSPRSEKWAGAKPVEGDINTSYFESSASISSDGKLLYFVSERPRGGFGMGDIYVSKKQGKYEWGKAINLGAVINDEYDQIGVFIHPDGKTLYFSSNGPKSIGGYDIFKSTYIDGKWSEPENLGYPINTTGDERFFSLSTDGRLAWFSSDRKGGLGDLDIWEVDFSRIIDKEIKELSAGETRVPLSILSGKILNSNAGEVVEDATLLITDSAGNLISEITTDENGTYFITLEADKTYKVKIVHNDFKENSFEVFMKSKETGTFSLEKTVVLDLK